jgi:competence protein ComEA
MQFGWKDYFNFFRSERKGIFFFILFISALCFFLYYLSTKQPEAVSDFSELENIPKIESSGLEEGKVSTSNYNFSSKKEQSNISNKEIAFFEFNPNDASPEELQKLGFSEKLTQTIVNYRKKGGRFYYKEDLMKIYGMDTAHFRLIEPYIVYEKIKLDTNFKSTARRIELNSCNKEDLMQLHGIGDKLSDRIIKFRDGLGGFYDVNQLSQVYGIEETTFNKIQSQLYVKGEVKKININLASESELSSHPYINYKLAKSIVEYRNQHGNYSQLTDLKKLHLMTDEIYDKLKTYLTID